MYFKCKLIAFWLNIIFLFMIIILVLQMDNNGILMKYYFHVYNHNSCISMDIIAFKWKYYFHVYDHNSSTSKWTIFAF